MAESEIICMCRHLQISSHLFSSYNQFSKPPGLNVLLFFLNWPQLNYLSTPILLLPIGFQPDQTYIPSVTQFIKFTSTLKAKKGSQYDSLYIYMFCRSKEFLKICITRWGKYTLVLSQYHYFLFSYWLLYTYKPVL